MQGLEGFDFERSNRVYEESLLLVLRICNISKTFCQNIGSAAQKQTVQLEFKYQSKLNL